MINNSFFLILRRMRAPIIVLIVIYAISVCGLTLVPGVDAEGRPSPPMSFFHAFYFISYTATTIGFGEIPNAFSEAQRLWVTVCIYLTVIGWSYSVVTLIGLLQDKGFQNTLTQNRFARRVARLHEPFYLICGCGETGSLVAHAFDRRNQAFVVLEKDEMRVEELDLQDFKTDIPALAGDARLPETLILAGLRHPKCRGVLAISNDEDANLATAIAVRLLNPAIPVIARARSPLVMANLASFGTDHVINPYERFAEYLALAVAAPERYRLLEILTGLPDSPLPEAHHPPAGHWILCGYGRFGHALAEHLRPTGITLTIIDPVATDAASGIAGYGTEAETLLAAGIMDAQGIIAGSDDDINNLSIAMTASELKPELFVVARQNHHANAPLFAAYAADFTMVATRIVAQEAIAVLLTPLLAHFLSVLRQQQSTSCSALVERIETLNQGRTPLLREICLNAGDSPALWQALLHGREIRPAELLIDATDRARPLATLILLLVRDGKPWFLPSPDLLLQAGDQLLLATCSSEWHQFELCLKNANELEYVLSGREQPGWLWQKLFPVPPVPRSRA